MIAWLKIAFRNLLKNSRRSVFTILAIGLGYAAVNVFGGFTAYVFHSLEESVIYGDGNGHISIFKRGYSDASRNDPDNFLLEEAEHTAIERIANGIDDVLIVSKQLDITGLASNGETSTVFVATSSIPSKVRAIAAQASGFIGRMNVDEGLEDDFPTGVAMSEGLARKLELGLSSNAILSAPTIDGFINALDVEITKLFGPGSRFLDDKLVRIHLDAAQELYDTGGVDRVNVLLAEGSDHEAVIDRLDAGLREAGLAVEVHSWEDLSPFYRQVKDMFSILFFCLFVIVFAIASMSVVNTINMAVLERTKEIGTLRALGANKRQIFQLFTCESVLLALSGVVVGVALTLVAWLGVHWGEPSWVPPPFSNRVPLEVRLVPWQLGGSVVVFLLLSVVAMYPPTSRALHGGVVEALGHA